MISLPSYNFNSLVKACGCLVLACSAGVPLNSGGCNLLEISVSDEYAVDGEAHCQVDQQLQGNWQQLAPVQPMIDVF